MKALLICLYLFLYFYIFISKSFAEGSVTINEFLAHPSSGNKEWVEFYNPQNTDISSYYLDDDTDFNNDSGSSSKKSLFELNKDNPLYPYIEISSFLNNSGDFVVIFSQNGELVDEYQYTDDPGSDISIGRFPDGTGAMAVLSSPTKGQTNSAAHIDSPTPSPSPTPVPTSKPPSAKSPTKAPATPIPTQKTLSSIPSVGQTVSTATNTKVNIPTSVLGQSTKSATAIPTPKANNQKKDVKILGQSGSKIPFTLMIFGIFFGICAIISFFIFKKRRTGNETSE